MHEKIFNRLISTESTTNSPEEKKIAAEVHEIIKNCSYFKENPGLCGLWKITGDVMDREIPYALYLAPERTSRTIVFQGHIDTVSVDNFYDLKNYARNPWLLMEKMKQQEVKKTVFDDLNSDQWIFGRGTADMKGGVSCLLVEFLKTAAENCHNTNILFIAVPDEETFSAGMRGAVDTMCYLKEKHNLDYMLLLTSESHLRENKEALYFDGTIGKVQLAVVVKGVPVHSRYYYAGMNPVRLGAKIVDEIDGNEIFSEQRETEKTPPPSCMYFRDTKEKYDVTLPEYVDLAFSHLMYKKSPAQIIEEVKAKIQEISAKNRKELNDKYIEWKEGVQKAPENFKGETKVLLFEEIVSYGEEQCGEKFRSFYEEIKSALDSKLKTREINFTEATLKLIHEIIGFLKFDVPLVVVALTPPLYPAFTNSDILKDTDWRLHLPMKICQFSKEKLGLDSHFDHYFAGISDMSYAACIFDNEAIDMIEGNMPLWGESYHINFEKIKSLQIPVLNIGPWGKDIHTGTERVNKKSLFEEVVKQIEFILDKVGEI